MSEHVQRRRCSLTAEEAAKHPLRRNIRTPGTVGYLCAYILIASSTLLFIIELIGTGLSTALSTPMITLWLGIFTLLMTRRREAEQLSDSDN